MKPTHTHTYLCEMRLRTRFLSSNSVSRSDFGSRLRDMKPRITMFSSSCRVATAGSIFSRWREVCTEERRCTTKGSGTLPSQSALNSLNRVVY
jgi:hypothetical protein